MKIILYGPPGVGKTTLITQLAEAGYPAFDLEELPSTDAREFALRLADSCFLGGADTQPRLEPGRINVLLTLPEAAYAQRRAARDAADPSKAEQPAQTVAQWMAFEWNLTITANERAIYELIEAIDHPEIAVPPKPQKSADNWTEIVHGHADAVSSLMSWAATRLTLAGRAHDQDKLDGPNPKHGEQRHHWYRADHSSDDPDLFDLMESACDTVATTLGRWRADPWNFALWSPPTQTVAWWDATYGRTLKRLWGATDAPALFASLPGTPDLSPVTNRGEDD